jgi:hypothetical protein
MNIRRRWVLLILVPGLVAAFELPWQSPSHWHRIPAITVVAREDDPRLPAVRQAVEYWNQLLAALPTPFRLGAITRADGKVSDEVLEDLSNSATGGVWTRHNPQPFAAFGGDLIIVLSDAEFVSFTSRIGDRMVIAIKNGSRLPLSLPNVLPNVVAHEIGHAIGLEHNDDPATLMCGRPAPCRPGVFASEVPKMFPLTAADIARLRKLYPPNWPAK